MRKITVDVTDETIARIDVIRESIAMTLRCLPSDVDTEFVILFAVAECAAAVEAREEILMKGE